MERKSGGKEKVVSDINSNNTFARRTDIPLPPPRRRRLSPEDIARRKKKRLIRRSIAVGIYILICIAAYLITHAIAEANARRDIPKGGEDLSGTAPMSHELLYYYNTLDYRSQLLYDAITDAAISLDENSEIVGQYYEMDEFEKIVGYIRADHPELFFVKYNELVLNRDEKNSLTYIGMVYCADNDEINEMKSEYDDKLEKIYSSIGGDSAEPAEYELAAHDYLVQNCGYPGDADDYVNTSYGALINGSAYCDGYAYAMQALMIRRGIDSCVVYGTAGEDNSYHVWNMIAPEEKYYHVDVMWDDANLDAETELQFHQYFNVSDKIIEADHKLTEPSVLPKAEDGGTYYDRYGYRAATEAQLTDVIYRALNDSAASGKETIEIMCDSTKDNEVIAAHYKEAVARINTDRGTPLLMEAFRAFSASELLNGQTLQIFYVN